MIFSKPTNNSQSKTDSVRMSFPTSLSLLELKLTNILFRRNDILLNLDRKMFVKETIQPVSQV